MRRLLAAAFAAVLAAASVRAQEPTQPSPPAAQPTQPSPREVNGHAFMPSLVIPPPVAVGSFAVGMLVGTGGATGPKYDAGGNPIPGETNDYTYAALGQLLAYEFAFLKNFTGRLSLLTSLYTGVDGPSALVVGTTVRIGGGAGLTWSFPLGNQFRLGASVDVNYSPQLNLLVGAAVLAALQGTYDPSLAFQQNNVFTWIPAVTAAWAPGSAVGFTAMVGYTGSSLSTPIKTYERDAVSAGVLGEVDFGKFTPVDVGLSVAFRKNFGINSAQSDITDVGGALLYTGKPDVSLGLEVLARTLTIRPQLPDPLKTTFPIAQIYVRYFWL